MTGTPRPSGRGAAGGSADPPFLNSLSSASSPYHSALMASYTLDRYGDSMISSAITMVRRASAMYAAIAALALLEL